MSATPPRRVLLAGPSGVVGRQCLELLVADPGVTRVTALVRRAGAIAVSSPKLEVEVVDFERLDERPELFAVDQLFCALGTTIKVTGSQEAFRHVDFDYPLSIARLAAARGARHLLLVSAMGARAGSAMFYNRVKGELEDAVIGLGFPCVTIARPSLLLGNRAEFRLGEEVGRRLAFLFPPRLRPVQARQVAAALVRAAANERPGVRIIANPELRATPMGDAGNSAGAKRG